MMVIYKIYWPGFGRYVGQTKGFRKRRNRHLREMADGTHHNKNLVKYFKKYGAPIIKIVQRCKTDSELIEAEFNHIQKYKGKRGFLNIQHNGSTKK